MRARLAVVALALAGCRDGPSEPEPEELRPCAGEVAVGVGPGARPGFYWQPACLANAIYVYDATAGPPSDIRWIVSPPNTERNAHRIAPGLRYGDAPPGTVTAWGPEPLEAGTRYLVIVFGATQQFVGQIGRATFTP